MYRRIDRRMLCRFLHWCALCALVCASFTLNTRPKGQPDAVQAAIRDGSANQPFASVVNCIEANGTQSPRFATTCFASAWSVDSYAATGDPNNGDAPGSNAAIYSFGDAQPDGSADLVTAGAANGHVSEATLRDSGATYGLAYSGGRNPASPFAGQSRLFSGAYTKRLTRFGPAGPGAVYVTRGGTTAPYVSIPAVVPGPASVGGFAPNGQPGDGNAATFPNGTSAGTFSASMGGIHTLYSDDTSIAWAGRTGLGDLDLDPQERFLYVVNLWNRLVYRVDTWNSSNPQSTVLPLPVPPQYSDATVCNASGLSGPQDLRPFGLLITTDSLYLGLVCSGHQSQNRGDLSMGILRFDIASGTWAGWVLGAFLSGYDGQRASSVFNSAWNPWRDSEAGEPFGPVGPSFRTHPQPIVADIEITERGDMLIGIRDRYGDMTGSGAMLSFSGTGQGDILLAPRTGTRSWGAPRVDQEDFVDNAQYVGNGDPELAGGALALVPGTHAGVAGEEVAGTFMNPYGAQSYGAAWWNTSAGLPQAREELYTFGTDINRFGKASGLGDVEILCEYRAIGDRVWRDDNGNGAQDGGEPNIDGVLVNLRDAGGALLAQIRTGNAPGISQNYRFYVQPFTQYTIEIDPSNFAPGGILAGYGPTLANAAADDTDSDLDTQNRIAVPAGPNREVMTTYDAGFTVGANVRIDKSAPTSAAVGSTIVYALSYTNQGPSTAANVTLRDDMPAGLTVLSTSPPASSSSGQTLTWSIGTLAPGASGLIQVNARVEAAATAPVTNRATISTTTVGDDPADNSDTTTTTILRASVGAGKSGPASVVVGSRMLYTLSYANSGSAPASSVQIVDTLPAGLTFVSANPAPGSVSGQTVTWNVGTLAAGASGTIVLDVQVAGTIGATEIVNRVCVSTSSPGATPANACATSTTNIQRPEIRVAKQAPAAATVGDQITYTLDYANGGNAAAQAVSLVDTLPAGLTFVSANPAPSTVNGQTLTWTLGTLAPGTSGAITLVTQSATTLANNSQVRNNVTIATTSAGDNPADNSASTTTLMQRADVWVTKSSPTTFPVPSGASVEYLIDAGNSGPAAAQNAQLVDQLPPQLNGVAWNCVQGCAATGTGNLVLDLGTLAAGATARVRVTGTAQTALAREDFVNTATIGSTTPQTRTDNDQSSLPGAVWTADVQVVKLSSPQVVAGTTFTATLLVRNNGPAVAQAVVLADTLPEGATLASATTSPSAVQGANLEWQLGDLASGASVEISLVLDAAADRAHGSVLVNTAQVTTTTPDRDNGNDGATAITTVVTQSDLQIAKSGPGVAYAGETIDYLLTYRNNGPSWARGVQVTDTLPPELAFTSALPPAMANNGLVATWDVGDLAPGQTGTIRVSAAGMPEQAEASRTVVNRARISSGTLDPEPANDQAEQHTALETVDVRIAKDMPPFVVAGAEFTATLQIENGGPLPARNVAVRDFLPSGIALVRSNPPSAAGPRWSIATLAAGEARRLDVVLRAPSTAVSGTLYLNTATIDTTDPDRDGGNNAASDTTTVRPNADLAVVKVGTPGPVRTGTVVTYTLTYHNYGPSVARGVTLVDEVPQGVVLRSSEPAPATSSGQRVTWQLGDLAVGASGSITIQATIYGALNETRTNRRNQAEIAGTTPDPVPDNNHSWYDLLVEQPDLIVSKDDGRSVVLAGDTLTYTIRLRNNGPVAAAGVVLREEPPAGSRVLSNEWAAQSDGSWTLAAGDVAPGTSLTYRFSLQLAHPFAAVIARNRVSVSHRDPDPTPDDNQDDDVDEVEAMRIGDRVWLDGDGDGLQDSGEGGLAGVLIHILDPKTHISIAQATTDASGIYLVAGLRPGTYDVQLAPETTQLGAYRGYRATTDTRQRSSVSQAAPDDLARDFGLRPAATTAVHLAELHADLRDDGQVQIRWRTLDEIGTLRFRVLWSATTDRSTAQEIASVASASSTGARYSVLDDHPAGYYWLVEVDRSGENVLAVFWPDERPPAFANAQFLPQVVAQP